MILKFLVIFYTEIIITNNNCHLLIFYIRVSYSKTVVTVNLKFNFKRASYFFVVYLLNLATQICAMLLTFAVVLSLI